MRAFWERMAPYVPLIEDAHLDREVARDLVARGLVQGPVLVVGAGHGLVVEALRLAGLEVHGVDDLAAAVEGARARRGLDVVLAEAAALPFPEERFATVIVASGVIDFLDDEREIDAVVREAVRVTRAGGRTLLAFWRVDPDAVGFFEALGVVSGDRFRHRDTFAISRDGPAALLARLARRVGWLRAVSLVARRFLALPPQEREQARALARIWEVDPDPDGLLAAVPEEVPMHGPDGVAALLGRLGVTATCHAYRTCTVAEVARAAAPPPR
jgi:SAM-dependent methyltransferase